MHITYSGLLKRSLISTKEIRNNYTLKSPNENTSLKRKLNMCEAHKRKVRREEASNLQSPKHLLFLAQITGYTAYLRTCQGPVGKHGSSKK